LRRNSRLSPAAARKHRFHSFDVATSPQHQTKKMVTSTLPQAKNPWFGQHQR
jgi:hypothetical protein